MGRKTFQALFRKYQTEFRKGIVFPDIPMFKAKKQLYPEINTLFPQSLPDSAHILSKAINRYQRHYDPSNLAKVKRMRAEALHSRNWYLTMAEDARKKGNKVKEDEYLEGAEISGKMEQRLGAEEKRMGDFDVWKWGRVKAFPDYATGWNTRPSGSGTPSDSESDAESVESDAQSDENGSSSD